VANTLNLFPNGAVGFIGWLDVLLATIGNAKDTASVLIDVRFRSTASRSRRLITVHIPNIALELCDLWTL
jgi:hypothetical protein